VAADGWLAPDDARTVLPRVRVPAFPQDALERALRRTWDLGVGDVPPGVVPYLVHPWVVANDKLRAAGWAPRHSNADAISEAVGSLPPRHAARTAVVLGAAALAVGALAITGARRRKRTGVRSAG